MSDPYLPPEARDAPELLPRVQIMGSTHSKVPFRRDKAIFRPTPSSLEEDVPGYFQLPGNYTQTLLVRCPHAVTTADSEEGGWIQAFSHLVRLDLGENNNSPEVSLAPFCRLAPVLKSLRVSSMLLNSQVFDLVCSLLLLEDLTLAVGRIEGEDLDDGNPPALIRPSTSPVLTGTLEIPLLLNMEPLARLLLDLPNDLHFR